MFFIVIYGFFLISKSQLYKLYKIAENDTKNKDNFTHFLQNEPLRASESRSGSSWLQIRIKAPRIRNPAAQRVTKLWLNLLELGRLYGAAQVFSRDLLSFVLLPVGQEILHLVNLFIINNNYWKGL